MSSKLDKWLVLAGCCFRFFFVNGCIKSNGVLLDDMVGQLETTNTIVAWAFSLQNALSYIMAPVIEIIVILFGKRPTAVCGGLLVGLGYIYCGLFMQTLWQLFVAYIVIGFGYGLMSFPSMLLVKDHFQDNYPTAISFASIFSFAGVAILPPLLQYLRNTFGERMALVLFGTLLLNLIPCGVAFRESQNADTKVISICNGQQQRREAISQKFDDEAISRRTVDKYFTWCNSLFRHPLLILFCTMESIVFFLYISWSLFLVSLGSSSGLPTNQAVLLSTSGGIGGLLGKSSAALMFYYSTMTPTTGCLLPFLLNGLAIFCCAVSKSYYVLIIMTFLSGICFGITINAFHGLLPSIVCKGHFQQALVYTYIFDSIGFQLGALISGAVKDLFGSATSVFLLDTLIILITLPCTFFWVSRNPKPKECTHTTNRS